MSAQLAWRLLTLEVVLARLVTAWLRQRDGTAGRASFMLLNNFTFCEAPTRGSSVFNRKRGSEPFDSRSR
jgi:hypothetical protein